jgi:HSP20 family molecular chaperone IbpA
MRLRELGKSVGGTVLRQVGRVASNVQERRPIPVDLLESDDAYLAVFDAAGAAQSDVQVRFSRGTVHVRIDRFREHHENYEMRFPGRGLSLDGKCDLPADADVDAQSADATLTESGALEVRIPKVGSAEAETPDDGDEPVGVDTQA